MYVLKKFTAPPGGHVVKDHADCDVSMSPTYDNISLKHLPDRTEVEGYILKSCSECGKPIGNQVCVVDKPYPKQVIYVERVDNGKTALTVKFEPDDSDGGSSGGGSNN